eukprot:1963046-Rhodomonas_salina.1
MIGRVWDLLGSDPRNWTSRDRRARARAGSFQHLRALGRRCGCHGSVCRQAIAVSERIARHRR